MFDFKTELSKITPHVSNDAKIYVWGVGRNWEWICKEFRFLVNICIDDYIDGFIDNNVNAQGTVYHGKTVYAPCDINMENAIILISIVDQKANKEILAQLMPYKMRHNNAVFMNGWSFDMLMRYSYECFLCLKDKHKGERCFIVGNGPSLLAEDLDKLKNEVVFATNGIYFMFDKTTWRPSYYVCMDDILLKKVHDEIEKKINCPAFYSINSILTLGRFNLENFYFSFSDHKYKWNPEFKPSFSEEPSVLQCGMNAVYDCIQLAVYMGFEEIILLGADNSFKTGIKKTGDIIYDDSGKSGHFTEDYEAIIADIYAISIDTINASYETAREFCELSGKRIINATRGGNLNVFKRVNFDELFG